MKQKSKAGQRRKYTSWTLIAMLLTIVLAPLPAYFFSNQAAAQAQANQETNQRSEFWRAVRQGETGYSSIKGTDSNVLIQNTGQNYRNVRNGPIATYGSWAIGGMIALIAVFFILFGRVKLENGRAGYTVERWGLFDRTLHWFTAISFIVLAITGLSLMYGRAVLIPYMGKDGFAMYAGFAKDLHNYLGPFFAVSLVIQLLKWMKHNFPRLVDIIWMFKGGGLIGGAHPSAGRMNAGEKIWYWILFWFGLALIASGFVLNFPGYGQTREIMQYGQIIHLVAALILIAVAIGHIYIGTLGTEGALEGMTTGRVDVEWAKQHHDLWYEELIRDGVQPDKTPDVPSSEHMPRTT